MAPSRAFVARISPLCRFPRKSPLSQSQLLTRISKAAPPRLYHSYDHPPPPGDFNQTEKAILSAAYAHVLDHGFTQHALTLGARDAGYLDISTNLLPEGPFSLIRYHLVTQREALAPKSKEIFSSSQQAEAAPSAGQWNVSDKVERLTWERLLGNRDVNHRWQEVGHVMSDSDPLPNPFTSLHKQVPPLCLFLPFLPLRPAPSQERHN